MKLLYILDNKGRKQSVILPLDYYLKIKERIEELEDTLLFDKVKLRKESTMPFSEYLLQRENKRRKG